MTGLAVPSHQPSPMPGMASTSPCPPPALLAALMLVAALAPLPAADPVTTAPALAGTMTLTSPATYEVLQRSAANTARMPIAGRTVVPAALVEARATLMPPYHEGSDGSPVAFTEIARPQAEDFSGSLEVPAGGWYEVTVRATDAAGQLIAQAAVQKVGVGEVFVAAGHSFCSNYNGDAPSSAQDDRVASCADWSQAPLQPLAFRHCDDPLRPGDQDRASPWPAVGDQLVSLLHVPVLWICTGMGGSTAAQWRRGAEDPALSQRGYPAFRATLQHLTPFTGLRAIVWLGNENDLGSGPTAESFSDDLRTIIAHARSDARCPDLPWIIAFDAYDPAVARRFGADEKQRRKERIDRGTEIVLQTVPYTYDGPQTDDLGPEYRRSDGDHFNQAGLHQLALRFARKITQAFFPLAIPAPSPPRLP
jgi:hypothetical protein